MRKILKLMQILLSEVPLLILLLPKNRTGALAAGCLYFLSAFLFFSRKSLRSDEDSVGSVAFRVVICMTLGTFFFLRWYGTGRIRMIAEIFHFSHKQFCGLITVLLCFAASFSLRFLSRFLPCTGLGKRYDHVKTFLFLLCTAAAVITFASACSPLYPINDWVDPNTMFTVGKGMLKGMVPYRDLYEQKGPLLLGIHALGAFISSSDFLGIWLIEIAACFFYLLIQYRILSGFMGKRALVLIPIIALLTYISPAFVKGDSAEELALPLLSYAVYVGMISIKRKALPSFRECFFIGVTSACILWMKYSLLGFYIGWFLFFLIIALIEKRIGYLLRMVLSILGGVFIMSIPVFLYFLMNHAVEIFAECYFLNNIRYYPALGSAEGPFRFLINLWNGLLMFFGSNPLILVFFLISVILNCLRHNRKIALFQLLTFGMGFCLIFMNGTSFIYYTFIFAGFWGMLLVWANGFSLFSEKCHPEAASVSFFVCLGALLIFSPNIYMLSYEKKDYPQYKVKDVIRNSGIENPSLLHFGLLDDGFNLTSDLIPQERFFCTFNLLLPEMTSEQQRYIDEAVPDFAVTCHVPLIESENYKMIGEYPGYFMADGDTSQFFLYQKVPAEEDPSS